ncbi:hypothetical protein AVEN_63637-1 [Araneus ventricosus]|uniref:Uncharacterized protein n=1 Tax=Araneus ventricosus TaxID=182803 RepID=A0A4Y2UMK4_ARAVE|nr:hypothetical protein AVEN_63637-1 [Araneus ventricosus]
MRGRVKSKLANIKKFIDSCDILILRFIDSLLITDKKQIVISSQQKLNSAKVLKEELETLFKQYLDIEEDEKSSEMSDEEMLELLQERDEIEVSLKCLLCKYNVIEVEIFEKKSDHNSDLKSYIDHIELKSKLPEISLPIIYGKIEEFSNLENQFVSLLFKGRQPWGS